MTVKLNRRQALVSGAAMAASLAAPAIAQEKPKILFSSVMNEQDVRAVAFRQFGEDISEAFDFEPYFNSTLFAQGTELVGIQRGNLDMNPMATQDISKQLPAWSILTSAYLFRDVDHVKTFLNSDIGNDYKRMAEEEVGVHVLGPSYYGTRHLGLRTQERVNTPEDMSSIKLRMPGGEAWQFLGKALGANPTAMAYAEVYTGLQSGTIDGQDNPLPNVRSMKFYEVLTQIALTGHFIAFDVLAISAKRWKSFSEEQQQILQSAADKALEAGTEGNLKQEAELADFFRKEGLDVYTPDVEAFRTHARQMYESSPLAEGWIAGSGEAIAAL
ncbi:TRAP transporter substrate-binding protein DctP [Salipiger sp.]|uniref:TRAP transporter substrate-binding protein DctP n=1 Tax=Salipiger sp. TaxID=2078585 RepID=UPI003A97DF0D